VLEAEYVHQKNTDLRHQDRTTKTTTTTPTTTRTAYHGSETSHENDQYLFQGNVKRDQQKARESQADHRVVKLIGVKELRGTESKTLLSPQGQHDAKDRGITLHPVRGTITEKAIATPLGAAHLTLTCPPVVIVLPRQELPRIGITPADRNHHTNTNATSGKTHVIATFGLKTHHTRTTFLVQTATNTTATFPHLSLRAESAIFRLLIGTQGQQETTELTLRHRVAVGNES